jgi:Cu2+-exporting ATPase
VLALAHGTQLLGLLAVRDALRPDALAALQCLKERGYGLGVLSGDREGPVRQLASDLNLEFQQLAWGLSPAQKLAKLEMAQKPVAMVGDGLNDAPALAAANLGIAVGTGTQIAQDSADLVVLGDRLMAVPQALELAKRCMAKVRQNLAWAFGYNLLVLPLAAGFLLPRFGLLLTPPLAALLMALSSLTVVANALMLKLP